ncbi:MAG: 6-pyruvoyl tetrahydropterin synthase family protein [Candidatus Methylacidiphilales bacterium]
MKITLSRKFSFDAAQSLDVFPEGHKCRNLHGHTFTLVVSVTGEVDPLTGMYYDHAEIARQVTPWVEMLDHRYLNEIEDLNVPSLENIARWFWVRLNPTLPGLSEIVLHETPTSWCTYHGD